MAISPAHIFGEIIGNFLENTIITYLKPIVERNGFYLDYKHERKARKGKVEVRWEDDNGNTHKMDLVVEENGSEEEFGKPRAFIEVAWRRYKKHSKNKVQEIAGAVLPIVNLYSKISPFYGVILAGEFTEPSINQLKSQGFSVAYFSYDEIAKTFESAGIQLKWEEETSPTELEDKIALFKNLSEAKIRELEKTFILENQEKLKVFVDNLESSLNRNIDCVIITPMHGQAITVASIGDACELLKNYDESVCKGALLYYEITIKYNCGDVYIGRLREKRDAIMFLKEHS